MIITVFGTGSPTNEGYKEAYELGRKIALAGHTLKNGGYAGTMEASAKGCAENGGKAIGVCVSGHKIAYAGKPNDYVTEVIERNSLVERLDELLKADRIIILKGKVGTLEELFRAWTENIFRASESSLTIPLYLVGKKNKELFDFLRQNDFIEPEYLSHINVVDSIEGIDFLL